MEVQEKLERIIRAKESNNWSEINSRQIEKRLKWYEENKGKLKLEGSDVRKAYTLILLEYFKLKEEEVPIIYEDERKIVWRSYNWCPVLEACKIGGFDTREICKKGWERSVQALIEKINPNLKFSRNYEKIRPYYEYCEEIIELIE